jgi:hypothetical protein
MLDLEFNASCPYEFWPQDQSEPLFFTAYEHAVPATTNFQSEPVPI